MSHSQLRSYLQETLQKASISRGKIPGLLGYQNISKALRRFDELLNGNISDQELINRLRASNIFSGPELEKALRETAHQQMIDNQEREMTRELRFRRAFVPHGWIETELNGRREPRGMILMAIRRDKMIHLPRTLISANEQLGKIGSYFNALCNDPNSIINSGTIFGDPVRILYRNTFDSCHVYDIQKRRFTGRKSVNWRSDEIKCLYN